MSFPDFKVVISDGGYDMVLDVSPDTFSESRSANWSPYDIVHTPVQVLGYSGTTSRTISITAKLVSRTDKEAKINKNRLQVIRHWVVNDFGIGNTGAPPPSLRIRAFRNTFPETQGYMTTYSVDYPSDVDWIETSDGDPFPVIVSVSMSFIETYSPAQLRHFNRYNIKGGPFKTEKIGKGGSGIGAIGYGSSQIDNVIDKKALDGLTGVRGNTSNSEAAVINESLNKEANAKESFSETVQKAREKMTTTVGSLYSKAQSEVMSNNFSLLPKLPSTDSFFKFNMFDQYKQQLKSPLVTAPQTEASKVNTSEENVAALVNQEDREQKNDF
jgi:hypothetical protein